MGVVMNAQDQNKNRDQDGQGFFDKWAAILNPKNKMRDTFAAHPFVTAGAFLVGSVLIAAGILVSTFGSVILATSYPVTSLLVAGAAGIAMIAREVSDRKKVKAAQERKQEALLRQAVLANIYNGDSSPRFLFSLKSMFAGNTVKNHLEKTGAAQAFGQKPVPFAQ